MEMTVKMLIEVLSQFDENAIVAIGLGEDDSADISKIECDVDIVFICFEENKINT